MTINIFTLAEPSDDRKIEMADKKQKRKTFVEQKKAYTVCTPDTAPHRNS